MSAYDNPERAILGLCADTSPVKRIESWSAQEALGFGEAVYSYIGEETKCYGYHNDVAKSIFDADLIASNSIQVIVDGVSWDPVVFSGTHDATMDLIVVEGQAQGYGVALDAGDGDNRTLFIKKGTAGLDVGVVTVVVTLGGSQAVATITYQSDQVFIGVAMADAKNVETVDARYVLNDAVNVMAKGKIWAAIVDEAVLANAVAYVQTSGASAGKFSASGTAVGCSFRSDKFTNAATTDVMAMVEVVAGTKLNAVLAW